MNNPGYANLKKNKAVCAHLYMGKYLGLFETEKPRGNIEVKVLKK